MTATEPERAPQAPTPAEHRLVRTAPWWTWGAPLAAGALLATAASGLITREGAVYVLLAPPLLIAAVFAAVHHAETVAVRLGETLGVIVLGLSVTGIEVSLIIAIMLETPAQATTIARDTVFAGVMVLLNGVVGISLLVGGLMHREQKFQLQGTASALGVLGTLACVTMILPDYTISAPAAVFSPTQLVFVAVTSLGLTAVFLFAQSFSQRAYFAPVEAAAPNHPPVSGPAALLGAILLLLTLAAVVLLADRLAPAVQRAAALAGLPQEFVGVVIATLVLLPEGSSAVRAALGDRIQTSLNLALGSAIQSTGLTIPAIALFSAVAGAPIELGLEPEHVVLLAITLFISTLTLSTGRTTILQGAVHVVILMVFLLIAAVP